MMACFCGSPHQLKRQWCFFVREREREREREGEQFIKGITNEQINNLTNIGKDEQTNGKTKTIHPLA